LLETNAGMSLAVDEIGHRRERRLGTGFEAWDDALTGGLVVPQTAIIIGRPGSRKSSYAAAIAHNIAGPDALYLCAEMPTDMIRSLVHRNYPDVAVRFAGNDRGATEWRKCEAEVKRVRPPIVIYDSIQAFDVGRDAALSDNAIRAVVRNGIRLSSELRHIAIFLCQVNAEGKPRCPQSVIHFCGTEVHLTLTHVEVRKSWHGMQRTVRLEPESASAVPGSGSLTVSRNEA
jgi:predicted ATP-dependent serine protease